ncbi:MAG: lysophospholipid acyltransferase family protein [Candidatus Dormibacteria bacterium]
MSSRPEFQPELPPLGLRLGLNAASATVRALGPLRYQLADRIGNATFLAQPRLRKTAIRNYRAAFPKLTRRQARRLAARSFREYARTAIDFLYVQRLPRTTVLSEMRVFGYESYMQGLQLAGKPGILVITHHGSWDAPGALAIANGVHLTSVMDDEGNATMANLVIWARAEIGVEVVPASRSPRTLLQRLRAGGWVALVADIPGDTPSVEVDFLNHRTRFSAAPGILAAHTGAPLVPATSVRTPNGGYLIELFPPVTIERGTDPAEAMGRIIPVFEAVVRRWPEQWYPFREDLFLDLPAS